MGQFHFGLPSELVESVAVGWGATVAIETGTYLGDTTALLADLFERVITIEADAALANRATERFRSTPGIDVVGGNSPSVIRDVAPTVTDRAFYWLDAHFCGAGDETDAPFLPTAGDDQQCPLLEELGAIDTSPSAGDAVILIDDARHFLGCPPDSMRRDDWPLFIDIVHELCRNHDRFVTVSEDVIVAGHRNVAPLLEAHFRRMRERGGIRLTV